MWRTVESNHADPALLITNPNVCRLPCAVLPAVPLPCRWRTSEWACGGDKEKRNSLYGQITDVLSHRVLSFNMDTPHSMKFKASHLKSCWILRTCPFYQYICNVTFKILIMGKLTLEQIQQIQKNLKVGKCPNCGYEGNKDVMPQEMQLVSFDINSKRIVDFGEIGSYPVLVTCCPQCGYISLFSRKFICR